MIAFEDWSDDFGYGHGEDISNNEIKMIQGEGLKVDFECCL